MKYQSGIGQHFLEEPAWGARFEIAVVITYWLQAIVPWQHLGAVDHLMFVTEMGYFGRFETSWANIKITLCIHLTNLL
jgi:hypothetical protein